jgi:hypothetical protein
MRKQRKDQILRLSFLDAVIPLGGASLDEPQRNTPYRLSTLAVN